MKKYLIPLLFNLAGIIATISGFGADTIYVNHIEKSIDLWDAKGVEMSNGFLGETLPAVKQRNNWWRYDSAGINKKKSQRNWLKFTIANNGTHAAELKLWTGGVDSMTLYIDYGDSVVQRLCGEYVNSRAVQYPYDLFTVGFIIPPGQQATLYASIYNNEVFTLKNIIQLYNSGEYAKVLSEEYIKRSGEGQYHAAVLGALVFCGLFILLMSIWFREKSFYFYLLFIAGALLYIAPKANTYSYLGTVLQYTIPYRLFFNEGLQYFFYASYTLFAIHLLNLRTYKWLHRFILFITCAFFLYGTAAIIGQLITHTHLIPHRIFFPARIVSYIFSGIAIIGIAYYVKSPLKKLFIAGCLAFIVFTILSAISQVYFFKPVKPWFYWPPISYFKTGVLLEALFFAVALGYKMFLVEKEKRSNYTAYITQLELNEKLIKEMNSTLEATVAERTKELELQKEKQFRLEYEQKISTLEMQALRSQMNPHFIFNSLNSIRYQIQSQQYKMASEYLMKFSKLLRLTLENSRKEVVTLEEELSFTSLYLEIEGQRFGDQYQYNITVDDALDSSEIEIPPMLLQPYVENAIKHGLMNSPLAEKKIMIAVYEKEYGFCLTITDNGVGRIASQLRKQESGLNHNSLGMQITNDRMGLFSRKYGHNLKADITDYLVDGKLAGTMVEIILKMNVYV